MESDGASANKLNKVIMDALSIERVSHYALSVGGVSQFEIMRF